MPSVAIDRQRLTIQMRKYSPAWPVKAKRRSSGSAGRTRRTSIASVRTTLTSVKRALGGEREAPILTCSADRLRLQVAKKSCERQRRCNGATDSALYLDTEYAPAPVATRPPPPDAENDR